ncbi:MAG TPA: hypothetical protein VMN57_02150 [Anaerolineales bacterium]|nr:hypothetical protein [Anaerolineales bacterium]
MDSLIPAALLLAIAAASVGLVVLMRVGIRVALIWAAAAAAAMGIWVYYVSLASRLPLWTMWTVWQAIPGFEVEAPWLSIDSFTWPVGAAFLTLTSVLILTSLSRLGDHGWRHLVWIFIFAALGLFCVIAGTLPAVMIAWAALDVITIIFLVKEVSAGDAMKQELPTLALNFLGIATLGFALSAWGETPLDLAEIPAESAGIVLLAVGMRGAAVARRPMIGDPGGAGPGLGFLIIAVQAAAGISVLARAAASGAGGITPFLLLLISAAVGLNSALRWLREGDRQARLPFWMGGMFSLAVAAAALELPGAVSAAGAVLLLCGGLVSAAGNGVMRYRWLVFLAAGLGSGVPFSPTWEIAGLVWGPPWFWTLVFSIVYSGLLAGLVLDNQESEDRALSIVPGVRSVHTTGLILLAAGLVIAGWGAMLSSGRDPENWWGGGLVILFVYGWFRLKSVNTRVLPGFFRDRRIGLPYRWLHRPWRRGATAAGFVLTILARLLEGEAAMLWALVLLSLIVSFFVQLGLGA